MKQLEKVKSLKDQIYEIIKEDIINQTYQNNTVLNEKKISQELNVSKTPVREAESTGGGRLGGICTI